MNDNRLFEQETYRRPTRVCGIVLKGGITSGIVYPLLACALAIDFRFRRVGGTSAGAIAAAAVAAAERGRYTEKDGGFRRLAFLPQSLGEAIEGQTRLSALFQPSHSTRPVMQILGIWQSSGKLKLARIAALLWKSSPASAVAGALPGLILLIASIAEYSRVPILYTLLVALISLTLILGGSVVVAAIQTSRSVRRAIIDNGYGVCSGFDDPDFPRKATQVSPLTIWLTELLDNLADQPPGKPLTFSDLWGGSDRSPAQRDIDLQMISTCVTHGRPYRLPIETDNVFYFDPDEWRRLFPESIVDWMESHPRDVSDKDRAQLGLSAPSISEAAPPGGNSRLRPFPAAADLPVVVAARMSLSFPLLISAIPLYAVDHSRPKVQGQPDVLEKCWFSDGGISSNFPISLFDEPLPRWPTFAINLRSFHSDYPYDADDERKNVWMPTSNRAGILAWWEKFDQPGPDGKAPSLGAFFGAIFNSMQNWTDNMHARMPGYRDRVVDVKLRAEEGGMNLNMPSEFIEALAERGRCAGELLRERFTADEEQPACPLTWDNHRWVRYRTSLAALKPLLDELVGRIDETCEYESDLTYRQLINRDINMPPNSYRGSLGQEKKNRDALYALVSLVEKWEQDGVDWAKDSPNPSPDLRLMPRI